MAANTIQTAQTLIIANTDPAIARAFGNNLQATLPEFSVNPNILITTQIVQETVTNLLGGGQANGFEGWVQFNSNNFLGSSSKFRYDNVSNILTVEGGIVTGAINTDYLLHANGDPWSFSSGNGEVGGANLALQYNNSGNFGGVSGSSYNPLTGVFTLGNVANIRIGGGSSGQYLGTDGAGNLSFSSVVSDPAGSNTQVQFNDAGTLAGNTNLTFVKASATLSTGNIVVTTKITAANVTAAQIGNTASNVTGNVITGTTATVSGNITSANVSTGNVVATAAITAGTTITATGNVTGANLVTTGVASITGNLSAGNVTTAAITASGNANLTGANVSLGAVANLHITGGSANQYLQTNGSGTLVWNTVSLANISNGNSNVNVAANGNVTISAAGNASIVTVTGTGANITGTANITGNLAAGNISTTALTASGNVDVSTSSNVSLGAVGNVKITGGSSGQAIITDGAGNLSFSTITVSNISNGTSNIAIDTSGGNIVMGAAGNANILVVTGTGANVTGTLNVTGAVTTTNTITTSGAFTSTGNFNLSGPNITLGSNTTVRITGGSANQFLQTDGTGTLTWADALVDPSGSNTQVQFNDSGAFGAVSGFTFNKATSTLTVANTVAAPNAAFTGANVWLGGVGNVHITGGAATAAVLGAISLNGSGNVTAIAITSGGSGYDIPPIITISGSNSGAATATAVLTDGVVTTVTIVAPGTGYSSPTVTIGSPSVKYLSTDGANNLSWREVSASNGGGTGTVAGSSTAVQFNDGGSLAGSLGFTFNKTSNTVTSSNNIVAGGNITASGNITATVRVVAANIETNTANVNIANIATTLTLSGNLNATSAPNVTLGAVGNVRITGGSANQYLQTDGAGNLSFAGVIQLVNGTSNVVVASSGNITVSSAGNANILTVTGTGANIAGTANVTGNLAVVGNITSARITASGNVNFTNSANVGLGAVGNIKITGGSNTFFLQTDGSGNLAWANINTSVSRISNGNSNVSIAANSSISFSANGKSSLLVIAGGATAPLSYANYQATIQTTAGINSNGNVTANGSVISAASVVANAANGFVLANASSGFDVTIISSPSLSADYTLTLPPNDGASGQYLITDGSGVTTWSNLALGGSDTQVQYNDSGVLGGSSTFTFTSGTNTLAVANLSVTTGATVSGNIGVCNVNVTGIVAATGNVVGGNITTAGNVTANTNITAAGNITATGNVTGGNLFTSGNVSAPGSDTQVLYNNSGNISAEAGFTYNYSTNLLSVPGNISSTANIVATANIIGGNLTTTGVVAATSNVSGGNLTTTGIANVTGNVIGGNIVTAGIVLATGNVTGGNLTTTGAIQATGNISSSANIVATVNLSGGNISTSGSLQVSGNASVTGNSTFSGEVVFGSMAVGISGGADSSSALGTQSLRVTQGGIGVEGNSYNSGNFGVGGNLTIAGIVTATGNVSGGNLTTGGRVAATGNVSGGNLTTTGIASVGILNLTAATLTAESISSGNTITIQINGVTYKLLAE